MERVCGECTACCRGSLVIDRDDVRVYKGHPCQYVTASGCGNYENRPHDPCAIFVCGWLQQSQLFPDWMRPDKSGLIFLSNEREWRGERVDIALPVDLQIPEASLEWVKALTVERQKLLIFIEFIEGNSGVDKKKSKIFGYGPPDFQKQVQAWIKSGEKLW